MFIAGEFVESKTSNWIDLADPVSSVGFAPELLS